MNLEDQTLGDIACNMKSAVSFFSASGIDFFCNGDRLLREELENKGIDVQTFIQELQNHEFDQNQSDDVDWRKENANELIAYILERYHSRHRKQFPDLIQLAQKVERLRQDHPMCPKGISAHLMTMQQDLISHMIKEEQVLFPMLVSGMGQMATGPVSMMEEEHEDHRDALEVLLKLTNHFSCPGSACNDWRALYLGLAELREDLMVHIHLENNILFKSINLNTQSCGCKCGCR